MEQKQGQVVPWPKIFLYGDSQTEVSEWLADYSPQKLVVVTIHWLVTEWVTEHESKCVGHHVHPGHHVAMWLSEWAKQCMDEQADYG